MEGYGFTNHLKLPHYVTFQSQLDNLRKLVKKGEQVPETVAPGGEIVNEDEDAE